MKNANTTARPLLLGAFFAISLSANADTIVVDDDGGVGVDFTDIPPAMEAANPGDLVLVHAGSYSPFGVTMSVTVLGLDDPSLVNVAGTVTIDGASDPGPIVVSRFHCSRMVVTDCSSVVVLDELDIDPGPYHGRALTLVDSADVRLSNTTVRGGPEVSTMQVEASRAELTRSSVFAQGGDCVDAYTGQCYICAGWCLEADDSIVSLALSSVIGGDGVPDVGVGALMCVDPLGGTGADGIRSYGSVVSIAGLPENQIASGDGGCLWGICGTPLYIQDGSTLRFSGVDLSPGSACFPKSWPECGGMNVDPPSTVDFPARDDPTLEVEGVAAPGSALQFRLHAPSGSAALLLLGREAIVFPLNGIHGDLLLSRDRVFDLGIVPGTGLIERDFTIPSGFPTGFVFYAQSSVALAGGEIRMTNSAPIVLK